MEGEGRGIGPVGREKCSLQPRKDHYSFHMQNQVISIGPGLGLYF